MMELEVIQTMLNILYITLLLIKKNAFAYDDIISDNQDKIPTAKASAALWAKLILLVFGLLYRCGGSTRINLLTFPTS